MLDPRRRRARRVGAFIVASLAMLAGVGTPARAAASSLAVYAGPPASTPALDSLQVTTDSTLVLYAGIVDSTGAFVAAAEVDWALDAPLGTLLPPTAVLSILDPNRPGTGNLQVSAAGYPTHSVPLRVTSGVPVTARIVTVADTTRALADTTLALGDSLALRLRTWDADGNPVPPPLASWSVVGSGGALDATAGASVVLRALAPGTLRVDGVAGALQASTGLVTLVPGPPARVRLSAAAASWVPVGSPTLSADTSVVWYALGEDATGYPLGAVSVTWTTTDSTVLVPQPSTGSQSTLDPRRAGNASIRITRAGALPDSSGTVRVVPGALASLSIETAPGGLGGPLPATILSADSSLTLHAVGRDAEGNVLPVVVADWSLTAPIGVLSSTQGAQVQFDATQAGTGRVQATAAGRTAWTDTLTIVPGAPDHLRVVDAAGLRLGDRSLVSGDSLRVAVSLRDADGNPLGTRAALWSWVGDSLSATPAVADSAWIVRTASVGSGRLRVTSPGVRPDTSGTLTVLPGAAVRIAITDLSTSTALAGVPLHRIAGDSLHLAAVARDAAGNVTGTRPVTWTQLGNLGLLTPASGDSTWFHARTPGSGRLLAMDATLPADTTGILTIDAAAPATLALESTPGNPADPLPAQIVSPDDSLVVYAVVRDAFGNLLPAPAATWRVQPDSALARLSTSGPSAATWITPRQPGAMWIEASAAGFTAASDTLRVVPGSPAGSIFVQAVPGTLRADGNSQAQLTLGPVRDRAGNIVADGTRLTLDPGGGQGIPAEDLDPLVPGVQRATLAGRATAHVIAPAAGDSLYLVVRAGTAAGSRSLPLLPPLRLDALGSVTPDIVTHADTPAWSVRLFNPQTVAAIVDSARLRLTDGNDGAVTAFVAPAITIAPGDTMSIVFPPVAIPPALDAGAWVPRLDLWGRDALGLAFSLAPSVAGPVRVADLGVSTWSAAAPRVVRGDTLLLAADLEVRGAALVFDAAATALLPPPSGTWSWQIVQPSAGAVLPVGPARLEIAVVPAPDTPMGPASLDLRAGARTSLGTPLLAQPATPVVVEITGGAAPRVLDMQPRRMTRGSSMGFAVEVTNDGDSPLLLAYPQTQLVLGNGAARAAIDPDFDTLIELGSTSTLRFQPLTWPDSLGTGDVPARLILAGVHDGQAFLDTLAADSVRVDAPAALIALPGSALPDTLGGSAPAAWQVNVRNAGGSRLDLDATTRAWIATARFDLVAPAALDTGATRTLVFMPAPGTTVPAGRFAPIVEARGTQNGVVFAQDLVLVDSVEVVPAPAVALLGVDGAPSEVTAGQTRPWTVEVRLQNQGATRVRLDSLAVRLWRGATEVRSEYLIAVPDSFVHGRFLEPDSIGRLRLRFDRTGTTPGDVRLDVEVRLRDAPAGVPTNWLDTRTTGGSAIFRVLTPAVAQVVEFVPDRAEVVAGQVAPEGRWFADLVLANTGGAALRLDSLQVRARVGGVDRTGAYLLLVSPVFAASGTAWLPAGMTDTLRVQVDRTGVSLGTLTLEADLYVQDGPSAAPLPRVQGTSSPLAVVSPAGLLAGSPTTSRSRVLSSATQPWRLRLPITNPGGATLAVDSVGVRFVLQGSDVTSEFGLAAGSPLPVLAGGGQDTLHVDVLTTPARAGSLSVTWDVRALEVASTRALVASRTGPGPFLEPPATLAVLDVTPRAVSRGVRTGFMVTLVHQGGAPVTLAAQSALEFGGYSLPLAGALGMAAGDTARVSTQALDIPASAPLGTYAAQVTLQGIQDGETLSAALPADSIAIQQPAALRILASVPSQARVTAGQTQPWNVTVTFQNDGGMPAILDSLRVRCLRAASDVTSEYAMTLPATFSDGTAVLPVGETRDAVVVVTTTGTTQGDVRLDFFAWLHEAVTARALPAVSTANGGAAAVRVESPPDLQVVAHPASQPRVVAGWSAAPGWSTDLVVRNDGEADVVLQSVAATAWIDGQERTLDFGITTPATWRASGDSILPGGTTDTLRVRIDRTAAQTGFAEIELRLATRDALSGAILPLLVSRSGTVQIVAPSPPVLAPLTASRARINAPGTLPWWFETVLVNGGGATLETTRFQVAMPVDSIESRTAFTLRIPDPGSRIAPGASLPVRVEVEGAPPLTGVLRPELEVEVNEIESGTLRSARVVAANPILLEPPAQLLVTALRPVRAGRGTPVDAVVDVVNQGGALALLDTLTTLQLGAQLTPLAAPTAIAAGDTASLVLQRLTLAADLPLGPLAATLRARGTHNGESLAQDVGAGTLAIEAAPVVRVQDVQASQPRVTAAQPEPWDVEVHVEIQGGSTYRLESAVLRAFQQGVERTTDWSWIAQQPSGATSPSRPAGRDTLRFQVTGTPGTPGPLVLEAEVEYRDLQNGTLLAANTFAGGKGSVDIEAPAQPVIAAVSWSQTQLSAGQTRPLVGSVTLRNTGQAAVRVEPAGLAAAVTTLPAVPVTTSWVRGDSVLGAGDEATIDYVFGPFAIAPGWLHLDLHPQVLDINRQQVRVLAHQDSLQVQAPADVRSASGQAPASVTVAQPTAWEGVFTVENIGGSDARVIAPALRVERNGVDVAATWQVSAPGSFETAPDLVLPAGATAQLRFVVTASDTIPGPVRLRWQADVEEINSGRRFPFVSTAELPVALQRPPQLAVVDSTLQPVAASLGQQIQIELRVRNDGEATLHLDPAGSRVRLAGTSWQAGLATGDSVAGGGDALLRFAPTTLPADLQPGAYRVEVDLAGFHHGNPWSRTLVAAASLRIDAATTFTITAIQASASRVTSGQTRPWWIDVAVVNGGAAARLDSTALSLTSGPLEVTSEFQIVNPSRFVSGADVLAQGAADTLRFTVQQTADLEGVVVLDARIVARDLNSGTRIDVRSGAGARGSVRVDAVAQPRVVSITTSQTQVSAGQTSPWWADVEVRNDGGSPWTIAWPGVDLEVGAPDDSVTHPGAFVDGADRIDAGESRRVRFTVHRTGSERGLLPLVLALPGFQETDGTAMNAIATLSARVEAVAPARAVMDSLRIVAPRAPYVNALQDFGLQVFLRNAGDAALSTLRVRVTGDGVTPADTMLAGALPGGTRATWTLPLRAAAPAGTMPVDVRLETAIDANDTTSTQAWLPPAQRSMAVEVQEPARLQIAGLAPSQARLSAGQATDWWVTVQVANPGEEPLRLREPRPTDLLFRAGALPQPDYSIVPPLELVEGGLEIAGGDQGTLVYRIASTGTTGGTITLEARLAASHRNDPDQPALTAVDTTTVEVDSEPGVRVQSAEAITWRREHGYDDFRVNRAQPFQIRVVVANTGGTPLDSIVVEVESQRGNSSIAGPQVLSSLGPAAQDAVVFDVTAGDVLSQPGLPEVFTARIVSARDRNSGLPVVPGAAVDPTTFAFVEEPARLRVEARIDAPEGARDGGLSVSQPFVVAARVARDGGAEVSANGRLTLSLPAGFQLENDPATRFVTPDQDITWVVRAPDIETPARVLKIELTQAPEDLNTGVPAFVDPAVDSVQVTVRAVGALRAQLDIAGPPGARDAVLSTGQTFTLEAQVDGDTALVQRRAQLVVPSGWSVDATTPPQLELPVLSTSRVSWILHAAAAPGTAALLLRVEAQDANDGARRTTLDTLQVTLETAARLTLAAAIVDPEEARDRRLVPGQRFRVRTWMRNHGSAGVASDRPDATHGEVQLQALPEGFTAAVRQQAFTLDASGMATLDWWVTAPARFRGQVETLRFTFADLPLDENTGMEAGVDADSSAAALGLTLADDQVDVQVRALGSPLVVAGQQDVPLLELVIHNGAENTVRLDSLGMHVLAAARAVPPSHVLRGFRILRDDAEAAQQGLDPADARARLWFVPAPVGAKTSPFHIEAGREARFIVRGDLAPELRTPRFTVGIRDPDTGRTLVRVVEAGSQTPLPLRVDAADLLQGGEVRVLDEALVAWNAPNPFHVGRETTRIQYRLQREGPVHIRIYTLQGGLVWEHTEHATATGPGFGSTAWDGRNGRGEPVRNGIYICDVRVEGRTTRFKIAVVR